MEKTGGWRGDPSSLRPGGNFLALQSAQVKSGAAPEDEVGERGQGGGERKGGKFDLSAPFSREALRVSVKTKGGGRIFQAGRKTAEIKDLV